MSAPSQPELRLAAIRQQCTQLPLPAGSAPAGRLAAQAVTAHHDHLTYLEALLGAELDERERRAIDRRITEAHFPRVKTLEEFDFAEAPAIPAATLRTLADGEYLRRAEPVLFLGETGTGKTHLATGLAVAACRQRRRVRFTTAAALVNDLVEAQHQHQLRRVTNRGARGELIVIDELGYVALAEVGAELLFQLIAERAEKAAVISHDQPPLLRVDDGVPQRPPLPGAARPPDGPGAYHRDGHRVVPLPPHAPAATDDRAAARLALPIDRAPRRER